MLASQVEQIFLNVCSDILCNPITIDTLYILDKQSEQLELIICELNKQLNTKYIISDFGNYNLSYILDILKRDIVIYSD